MIHQILSAYTTTGTSDVEAIPTDSNVRSWQCDSGTGDATVVIQVSADGNYWQDFFTLSPESGTPDGNTEMSSWSFVRASVTANTGTLNLSVNY